MAPLAGANTFSHKAWRQCRMCEKFMLEFTSTQLTAVSNKFHSECFFVAEADLASTELNNLNLRQFSINNDFSICVLGSRLYVVTFSAVNSIRPSSSQILENEDQNTRTNVASSPTKKKKKKKSNCTSSPPLLKTHIFISPSCHKYLQWTIDQKYVQKYMHEQIKIHVRASIENTAIASGTFSHTIKGTLNCSNI